MHDEIVRLGGDRLAETMALFSDCFRDDSYYAALFPDPRGRAEKLSAAFGPSIAYCLTEGDSFGIFRDGQLAAFVLTFDYQRAKWRHPARFRDIFVGGVPGGEMRYETELHGRIERLGERVRYLLSLAVGEGHRRTGLAGALLDFVTAQSPAFAVVSDVSNDASLPLYGARGFSRVDIAPGYHFVCRPPAYSPAELCFEEDGVALAVAGKEALSHMPGGGALTGVPFRLRGYAAATGSHGRYFVQDMGAECEALLVNITYEQLLFYQRYINLADCAEACVPAEGRCVLLYAREAAEEGGGLWDDTLREMVKTRQAEWNVVPDTQVLIPVRYDDEARLAAQSACFTPQMAALLRFLDFRTSFEAGVPKGADEANPQGFKSRICRYYLGRVPVRITQEITAEHYDTLGRPIGAPANVDLLVSIDRGSNCGVFSLVSLSTPFLISHFMDNVIRNQLQVYDPAKGWVNLYAFMEAAFGLHKMGTPKLFVTVPRERDCLDEHRIASMLLGETIYASDEEMGKVTDGEILAIVRSESGMGQYDRAFVCVHTNVFLQFCAQLRGSVHVRLRDEAVTYFYMELLMFEEAAIQIASASISSLLSMADSGSTTRFLKKTLGIQKRYAETIEFWDVQVNYPSSKRSVSMIREAFRIDELIARKDRDSAALREVFDTRRDVAEQTEAVILNYIVLFLTLMQGVFLYVPALFAGETFFTRGKLMGTGILVLLVLVYRLLKRAAARTRE